ncbi:MAG TPA: hypothetical protein VKO62_07925 [Solirubrobacterales bacterium]|nr:hypothetical protein [Solirubrobacterales bacterium]
MTALGNVVEGPVRVKGITHEMGFARDVGDGIVFMDSGVIVEEGPAKELVENPKEERTKRFLGLVLEH